jgi:APA family basic amino acid/polyamine antiporter
MAGATNHTAETMMRKLLGKNGETAMSMVILCSTFGAINSNLLEAPRVAFAMGRDGVFFRWLGRVHPEFHTPAPAIAVTALLSIGVVALIAVGKACVVDIKPESVSIDVVRRVLESLKAGSIFDLLTNCVVFATSVFFTLGVVAILLLRRTQPDRERPYKTWGYPAVPILFLAINSWFLWQVYQSKPLESGVGIFLILLGLPVYGMFRRTAK